MTVGRAYDVLGPLPAGTTVLEASAGTGKTYALAALATRYVAEGVAELPQLLLATFSRAATQELRERVRDRMVGALRALVDPSAHDDALVHHLAAADGAEVALRRQRLRRALAEFDAATIATTHSFCQQVLDSLGMAGDHEPDATFVESVDDLLLEVVDDLYLRRFAVHGDGTEPLMTPADARTAARAAVRDRSARLEPADADRDSAAGQRFGIARAAREELERRKRAAGLRDFDDLLALLRDVLADPARGPAAAARLRERYRVVLVDEFQDTDPVQWEILRRAFHGHRTLVLIGDPKQAIYAFRGAEVLSYLDARRVADSHQTLGTNWRSDAGLLRGLQHLQRGAALGHPDIVVPPVDAAYAVPRLVGGDPGTAPLRLRVLDRTGAGPLNTAGFPAVGTQRERVACDVAADVVRLLDSGARLALGGEERAVRPGDVAVLVRKHTQAELVRAALQAAAVPAVVASSSSVFATPSARDWLWLLQALEHPHRSGRVRLAALTPLVGRSAAELDDDGDRVVDEVGVLLRDAGRVFDESGLAAAWELLSSRTRLDARVLATEGGDRRLTDLRHLAQLLNRAAVERSLGLGGLVGWLAERVREPESAGVWERSRRLESDAAAVQVVTVHGSKGLEFPIVLVPYGWDGARGSTPATLVLHDESGARVLDVGGGGPGWKDRERRARAEDAGEELRLLYVAVTRAQCAVTLWWAPTRDTRTSPLHRLLLGRSPGSAEVAASPPVPEDENVLARLRAWAAVPEVAVEPVGAVVPRTWRGERRPTSALAAAEATRRVDTAWRRTSYSALVAGAHDEHRQPGVGSEPEQPEKADEPDEPVAPGRGGADGPPSPMNGLPSGRSFGTLVHEVLEVVDTTAPDLAAEVLRACRRAVGRRLAAVDPAALADALLPVLHTPLATTGPPAPTLAQVAPRDRLAELDFELPLGGGDRPSPTQATLRDVADLLRVHLPADDPLGPYADRLAAVDAPRLRGYLSGSIDAVLRLPGDGGPAYVVVDYKTNRLGAGDLTALDYTQEAMAAEMVRAHYPLQALLYAVALHRFLRWRQPAYDPGRHLGGVQYLFVRGMVGPATPPGCGVFDWRPPAPLVTGLSDLLAGSP